MCRWLMQALLLMPFIICLAIPGSSSVAAHASHSASMQSVDCEAILAQLTTPPDWYQQLLDPVISSQEELLARLELYVEAHQCLTNTSVPISPELDAAKKYLEYFLIFAFGYDTPEDFSTLKLVDLSNTDDPAIRQLREDAGLPAPSGFVFVRFYHYPAAMPPRIRHMFAENTAGLTLLTRYIAILEEDRLTWEEQILQAQTLPKTISHELVHAYINSSLGIDVLDRMPRWYAEGIAIHLSNSGEEHVVVGSDATITSTSPQDYREYRDNFRYLEAKLGRERLLEVIRQSVEEADPGLVYRDLGYTDDEAFIAGAKDYWQRRLYLVSGGIIIIILLAGWWVFRSMPEVRCRNCSYAAKRREFESGFCPQCYFPYDG